MTEPAGNDPARTPIPRLAGGDRPGRVERRARRAARHPSQRALRARPVPERPVERAGRDPQDVAELLLQPGALGFRRRHGPRVPPARARRHGQCRLRWRRLRDLCRRDHRARAAASGSRARRSSCSAATTASPSRSSMRSMPSARPCTSCTSTPTSTGARKSAACAAATRARCSGRARSRRCRA